MSEYDPAVKLVDADGNPVGYAYYDTTNGGIALRDHGSDHELTLDQAGEVFVRQPDGSKEPLPTSDGYTESVVTGTVSGTTGLDLTVSNFFRHTLIGDTTFEFQNPSSDPAGNSFTLIVEQDSTGGWAISWPTSVQWDGGSAPSFSSSANDKHMIGFMSPDGGSTWIGVVSATGIA